MFSAVLWQSPWLAVRQIGPAGLEPATPCLEGRCSIHLSYGPDAVASLQHWRSPRNPMEIADHYFLLCLIYVPLIACGCTVLEFRDRYRILHFQEFGICP